MTVYILGGGPAGLAVADGLAEGSHIPFTVIEQDSNLGGLAQTLRWNDYGFHDLGPHKIFTLDKSLMARVENLLPQQAWLTRPKKSSIFIRGHFLPYPPSPFSLIGIYGTGSFLKMALDYATARIKPMRKTGAGNFEEDLKGRLGTGLYEALFKPIALKLWGEPTQLDSKLSQGRVQTPSLTELIGRLLGVRSSSDFEALEFLYPRGGLQKIWESIVNKTPHQGAYLTNQKVTRIIAENGRVIGLRLRDVCTGEENEIDLEEEAFVFSTLPLGEIPELMEGALTAVTSALIKKVVNLNDLILVFLKVDKPSLLDESWVFVPDPEISFHRLSEQESFDPEMTPGGSIICCEIMSSDIRPIGELSDEELVASAMEGLSKMGYTGFSILDQRIIRLPSSYPVYRSGFEEALEKILGELDSLDNFRTIGRQGAFNYIGTLDAMDVGYGAAQWIITNGRLAGAKASWQEERHRTSHYPVVD